MDDVFVSRPTYIGPEFLQGLQNFLRFLETQSLRARTLGAGEYPTDCPLDEVIQILRDCRGAIILGYPQIIVTSGKLKNVEIPSAGLEELLLPTEWNHIEAALAYSMRRPLLVIHHTGVSRGIFDRGATNKYIHQVDLTDSSWPLSEPIAGALQTWKTRALALAPYDAFEEKDVDPEYVTAIGLERSLAAEGYRMVWGDIRNLDRALDIEGYERIVWEDSTGKKWLLSARQRGQVPLKTRKSTKEIEQLRQSWRNGA